MRNWIRPRSVIALLAGIAAGLLVWMLPPLADWTRAMPKASVLNAVSAEGRYLVTSVRDNDDASTLHVWDRAGANDEPSFTIAVAGIYWHALLSPDEKTLAIINTRKEIHELQLFDLASRQKIKSWGQKTGDHFLFSSAGELLCVNDGVVSRLEDGRAVRPLPKPEDGFKADEPRYSGAFIIYREEDHFDGQPKQMRVYSLLTGAEAARQTIPGQWMNVDAISRDGQVIAAHGWAPKQSLWSMGNFEVLADARSGSIHTSGNQRFGRFRDLSGDGQILIWFSPTVRPEWLSKWWPIPEGDTTFHVTYWQTGAEVAQFRNIRHLMFSPQGNQLVVMRDDDTVAGYDWPLPKPWGLLAGVTLGTAGLVYGFAGLWARSRRKKTPVLAAG